MAVCVITPVSVRRLLHVGRERAQRLLLARVDFEDLLVEVASLFTGPGKDVPPPPLPLPVRLAIPT